MSVTKTAGIMFKDTGDGRVEITVYRYNGIGPAAALLGLALLGIEEVADIRGVTKELSKAAGQVVARDTVLPLDVECEIELAIEGTYVNG